MYQIAITIFSFIPVILWAAGLVTRPLMTPRNRGGHGSDSICHH